MTRETLAMTAYRTGDFALAIRELRTFRRLSGRDTHLAIMVDSERGLGRPEKAIETGLEVDVSTLETADRVHLAIAMSGARLDLGQTQQALFELEIPELDPKKGFSWSPELFGAYATVLEDLGRDEEAKTWFAYADRAEAALEEHFGGMDEIEVLEITEYDDLYDADEAEPAADEAADEGDVVEDVEAGDAPAEVGTETVDSDSDGVDEEADEEADADADEYLDAYVEADAETEIAEDADNAAAAEQGEKE